MKVKDNNSCKKDFEDSNSSCFLNGEEWKAVEDIIAKLKKKIEKTQLQSQPPKNTNIISLANHSNENLPSDLANYEQINLKNLSHNEQLLTDFNKDNKKDIKEIIIKQEKEGIIGGNLEGMLQANYEQLLMNSQMQMIRNMMFKNQMVMMERIMMEEHLRTWGGFWRR